MFKKFLPVAYCNSGSGSSSPKAPKSVNGVLSGSKTTGGTIPAGSKTTGGTVPKATR